MLTLGPHIIRHQFEDGEVEETPVRFNFLGPTETVISETITITQESGEVIVELPNGEHRTFIEAENTFALVGRAIKLTEALFLGWSLEDGGKAFRLLPGDVKGPGDMFLWLAQNERLICKAWVHTPLHTFPMTATNKKST